MALFSTHLKTGNSQEPLVHIVEDVRDTEQAPIFTHQVPLAIPRWPRVVSACVHILVILLSIVILGLGAHTLAGYSPTRGIHFGGVDISWPKNLNLRPIYFFLTISAMSVVVSLPSAVLTLRRLDVTKFSMLEVGSTMVSLVMLLLWLAANFLQHHSEQTPKKDLLSWACKRTGSPTNVLVRYETICHEQLAIKDIAIVIALAHFAIVLSSGATWHYAEKRAKKSSHTWRKH